MYLIIVLRTPIYTNTMYNEYIIYNILYLFIYFIRSKLHFQKKFTAAKRM